MASDGNRSQMPNPAVSMAKKTSSLRRSNVWSFARVLELGFKIGHSGGELRVKPGHRVDEPGQTALPAGRVMGARRRASDVRRGVLCCRGRSASRPLPLGLVALAA